MTSHPQMCLFCLCWTWNSNWNVSPSAVLCRENRKRFHWTMGLCKRGKKKKQKQNKTCVCIWLFGFCPFFVKWNWTSAYSEWSVLLLSAKIYRFSSESASQYTDSSAFESSCGTNLGNTLIDFSKFNRCQGMPACAKLLGLCPQGRYREVWAGAFSVGQL